jgi:hypothetical protein
LSGCCEYNNQPLECIEIQRNSLLAWELLALQEGFSTIELDRIGPNGGPCGFFIIGLLERPNNYQMLNENSAPQNYVFGSLYENVCFVQKTVSFVRKPNFKVQARLYSELLLGITAVCQLLTKMQFVVC